MKYERFYAKQAVCISAQIKSALPIYILVHTHIHTCPYIYYTFISTVIYRWFQQPIPHKY